MKPIKCEAKTGDAIEKKHIDDDVGEPVEIKRDRRENAKIKFVQGENADQNYHTPISLKMNKFMMCFKSEPDLSRVQNGDDNAPTLNRGRFIAKKLLSGVSMINLRRPFTNANEKAIITTDSTTTDETSAEKFANVPTDVPELSKDASKVEADTIPATETPPTIVNAKIDDDDEDFVDDEEVDREYDDSVDKENRSPHQCNTIDYMAKLKPPTTAISCGVTMSDSLANDSVSPITKSTHRMSKAMQVSNNWIIVFGVSSLTNVSFCFLFPRLNCIVEKKGIDNDTTIT